MQCSVPFVQQSLCLQRWVYNDCTVRFVYRIFEYSFILGIFDSLGFRIFVLALEFFLRQMAYDLGQKDGAKVRNGLLPDLGSSC